MASEIGIALISTILERMAAKTMEKVNSMVVDKVDGIVSIERDISELQTTLFEIQDIVQVAKEKQIDKQGKPRVFIRNWLRDLLDIGYEARDVLDDFITFSSCITTAEEAKKPVNTISSLMLSCFCGLSSDTSKPPLAILNRLAKDIRSVRERFDEKKKEGETLDLRSVVGEGSESVRVERKSLVGPWMNRDDQFVGRKEVKDGIIEKILHPSDDNCVHVVAIWGMGGIGKTTLAQSIYNDEKVEQVPRSWLCVGVNNFSVEKVIREILIDTETICIEKLQKKFVEKFKGDRFLIVLDDVWDVDGNEWDLLFNPITHVGKGGLIIITTRRRQVCTATNTQTIYDLKPLSKEDSWSIFESCAYVNGKSDSTPDLKGIGQEIAKKLNGFPLALRVVGRSLLHKDSSTWTKFLESKFSKNDEVMSALRWSYIRLPQHLRTCFTYCSLFPKGHEFDKKVLVEMWMAHDLIQEQEQKRPEDVGAQYFKELVNNSLLQCVDGKYVMHDSIHDLALLDSNGEFASANSPLTDDQMKTVRHITCDFSKIPHLCKNKKLLTLYTIWSYENYRNYSVHDDVFKKLKSIRVLVLSGEWIKKIPNSISELKLLRYLDVSETCVECLPDSLCHLYNLQMIAVLPHHAKLPRDIVNIFNLRHIRANLSTCKGVGQLTSLQELSSIRVCEGDNIRELGEMQRLRGKLTITGLENVEKLEDGVRALMDKQTLLDELQLGGQTISAQVLDALGCPPNLMCLEISGYTGLKPPSWMADGKHKFRKLETLELYNCPKLESLPPLGELISLKHLSLLNVGVKRLGKEFYGKFTDGKIFFPSLESLRFCKMEEWEEWNEIIIKNSSMSFFPCLTRWKIKNCAKLLSVLPIMNAANFMTSLSCLKISYCDGLVGLQLDALVSLKELKISRCKSLDLITPATTIEILKISQCERLEDIERLPSVKHLDVNCCNMLKSIPCLVGIKYLNLYGCERLGSLSINIRGRISLERLHINGCPTLELAFEDGSSSSSSSGNSVAVPIHNITTDNTQVFRKLLHNGIDSLESLSIRKLEGFKNFDERVANNFSSLKTLEINDCSQFQSLPPNLHNLSSLERLYILSCPQFQSLPEDFHKLSSLKSLCIEYCPQLQSLPANSSPFLRDLTIEGCPLLYERCKEGSGLDWHKIQHIRWKRITTLTL